MSEPLVVQVIVASVREGRLGEGIARWLCDIAAPRTDLACELVDLRAWDLPQYCSKVPPMRGNLQDDDARRWAAHVDRADAYVLVTPEYNHGYPAPLKNALDLVYHPWGRKPVGFVSYGGSGGGVRAVEQLRLVAVELRQAPVRAQVSIPRARASVDAQGGPKDPRAAKAAIDMLDELAWWGRALAAARDADADADGRQLLG